MLFPPLGRLELKLMLPLPVRVPRFVDPLFRRTAYVSADCPPLTVVDAEVAVNAIVEEVAETDVSPVRYPTVWLSE